MLSGAFTQFACKVYPHIDGNQYQLLTNFEAHGTFWLMNYVHLKWWVNYQCYIEKVDSMNSETVLVDMIISKSPEMKSMTIDCVIIENVAAL